MSLETDVIKWFEQGRGQRNNFDNRWQRFLDYTGLPRKDITTERDVGATKTDQVFSSCCSDALHTFANFLQGNLFPQGSKNFSLRFLDDELNLDPDAVGWLELCVLAQHQMFARTNFYSATLEWITDLAAFGNSDMLIESVKSRSPRLQPICFTTLPAGSYVWGEGEDGQIDKTIRLLTFKARDLVMRFENKPGAQISESIKQNAENSPLRDIKVLHGIIPRDWIAQKKRLKTDKDMDYASVWIDYEGKRMIYESGYEEYPCAAGRWAPIAGEIYARGLGDEALPDTAVLNQGEDMLLTSVEKKLDPPLLIERNSVIGPVDFQAGGTTVIMSMNRKPEPLIAEGTDVVFVSNYFERKEASIQRVFFYQPIKALISNESPQPEKTAFEVSARLKLLHQIIAPVSGRITEGIKKMIDVTFNIMLRRNMFPMPPPSIAEFAARTKKNIETEVEFQGVLSKSQRVEEANAIMEYGQGLLYLSQFDKNVLYKLDAQKAADILAQIHGTVHIQREQAKIDLIVEKDNQIEQLMQQLQVANSVADTAGKLTPALQAANGNGQAA